MSNIFIDGKEFKIFIPQDRIEQRIKEIALEIKELHKDEIPVFIIILNGAFMFAGEFFKTYTSPCEIEFVKLISYIGTESSGEVINCIGITEETVKNKKVIILEDIIDSGITMEYFIEYLTAWQPKSIEIASLLFKPLSLKRDVNLNYFGFSIDPLFVVGYGLDFNHQGRNLTNIYQIVNS
jgi:hypoxanthine phosphoribosyltransferase